MIKSKAWLTIAFSKKCSTVNKVIKVPPFLFALFIFPDPYIFCTNNFLEGNF